TAQGERRDGNDRRGGGGRLGPQGTGCLDAGELGQLEVHENEVRTLLPRRRHPGFAVGRLEQAVRSTPQEIPDNLPVQLVVLNVENSLGSHTVIPLSRRSGIAKKKVEPLLNSLSTQIRPPCISTNFLAMLSPSPEPPNSLVMLASPCRNSAKMVSILSAAIPIPVSATR